VIPSLHDWPDGSLPDNVATLKAMLLAGARHGLRHRPRRRHALEIEKLKFALARLWHERFGTSSEQATRLIDQLALQLADLEDCGRERGCGGGGQGAGC
jgi:hypothetical protein